MADTAVYIMMGLGIVGMLVIIGMMGFWTQNKDNGAEIQKNLGIVAGVTGIIILFLFAPAAYIYFMANVNYLTPFLLIMCFVNLFLSLFAVSAATLNLTKA
jgi:hypothetical protein